MTRLVAVGDCVEICQTWSPAAMAPEDTFQYIDLSSVDRGLKRITGAESILGIDAPSRARQLVKAGDVLVSTVRPNLNGVAMVPKELDGAIASTGFTVLRAREDHVDRSYLLHWVKHSRFIDEMVRKATGASYPAVSDRIVRDSLIPLPELPTQRRIAAILDKADALRTKRREAIDKLDRLLKSVFLDMFGDPVANPKSWPVVSVGEVFSKFVGGKNVECPDESDSPYRILKVSAVTNKVYRPDESKPAPERFAPAAEAIVEKGDLLFSRANTTELVAATAYVWETPANMVLPDKLWKMRVADEGCANVLFLWGLFKDASFRHEVSKRSSGTSGSMKNIAKSKLVLVPMPLPPLPLQTRFAKITETVEQQKRMLQAQADEQEALFSSLQHRAFSGTL